MHPLQEKPTLAQLETTFSLRNEEISDSSSNLTLQKAAAEGPQGEVGRRPHPSSRGSQSHMALPMAFGETTAPVIERSH